MQFFLSLLIVLVMAQPDDCEAGGRLEPNNCNAPVAVYVIEDSETGWQIDIVTDDETMISAQVPDHKTPPDRDTLIDSYATDGTSIMLYWLASGEYQVLSGPAFDGQVYVLNFNVPPDGKEYRHDFAVVE